MSRCGGVAVTVVLALPASIGIAAANSPRDETPPAVTQTVTVDGSYRGQSAAHWAAIVRHRTRQLAASRAMTHKLIVHKWQPTVMYALRLASAVSGVPLVELAPVAHCESTYNPFARNGKYLGLFQLGWAQRGARSSVTASRGATVTFQKPSTAKLIPNEPPQFPPPRQPTVRPEHR